MISCLVARTGNGNMSFILKYIYNDFWQWIDSIKKKGKWYGLKNRRNKNKAVLFDEYNLTEKSVSTLCQPYVWFFVWNFSPENR